MTSPAIVVDEYEGVKAVATKLLRHGFNAVPVLSRGGELIGVISEADLVLRQDPTFGPRPWFETNEHRAQRDRAHGLRARDIMTRKPISVRADKPTAAVARLMHRKHLKSVPVVSADGAVVGMISRRDLVSILTRSDDQVAAAVRDQLRSDPVNLNRIIIDVDRGIVTLSGWVGREEDVEWLRAVVQGVEGVVGVRLWLNAEDLFAD